MRKLTITTFLSLDGVMQAPGGPDEDRDGGFVHGGWVVPYVDERLIQLMTDVTARAGALLLGRRTYDIFAATWPLADADDPIGARMNGLPKYVASTTLGAVTWRNSTLLTGDVAEAVAKLKKEDGGEIQVHGSGRLAQTLLRHDLVDEFHLLVFPVLLGSGTRLFAAGTVPSALLPVAVTTMPSGVVICTYTRAGGVEHGAMGPETGNWR
ncbi:dihydrofolate reductase family protein [Amycolatopsis acidiphila]|uniref:Dihydrofolate reductase n=1 Tax=Amycolatopsis acidiphila TaxID=715473 RepID=A0A558ALY9_9PSEU|nr:dihydrofolate reductase family protein [Amycolatopsis acidiphila]TVT25275.1 dihydrofolate reductase [Amycolatopsis acidiphila]UIJ62394.1 dihydrofolate reductase family protein [Amycolatopsis acidiphila]GHG83438.1 deaminase reductase [Amycolatopsis acidiphila]